MANFIYLFDEAISDIIYLFDEAMSDMEIYSVEPCNIRRGAAESDIILARLNKSPYTKRRIE